MRISPAWVFLLAACGGPPPPPPPPSVALAPEVVREPVLQWSAEGDQIVVDAQWRLNVTAGTFSPVGATLPTDLPALSPSGLAVVFESGMFSVPGGRQVKVPSFFEPPLPDVALVGYWLDRNRIYLHQRHPDRPTPACRVFDLVQNGFTEPTGCVSGDFPEITRLQRGPGDLLAVHTRDGETLGLRIVRYTPEGGQREVAIPQLDLRPNGDIVIGFQADGGSATLISACLLNQPRPCSAPPSADGRLGLYVLDLARGRISERLALVSPGTTPAPDGRRLAWLRNDQVCIGSPRTPGATWCHTLPR